MVQHVLFILATYDVHESLCAVHQVYFDLLLLLFDVLQLHLGPLDRYFLELELFQVV
jgi:hypothetical protein